jgi:hypothetical protein
VASSRAKLPVSTMAHSIPPDRSTQSRIVAPQMALLSSDLKVPALASLSWISNEIGSENLIVRPLL